MAAKAASDRIIVIRKLTPAQRRKRDTLRRDTFTALRWYFPERFYNDFTVDQREVIEDMSHIAINGGDLAEAMARGEGKTSIVECCIALFIAWGVLRFPVIFAATGRDAEQILANIKGEFEMNDRLEEHFPEICAPVRALEGAPQRAGGQTARLEGDGEDGESARTRMQWSGDGVRFPTVKGSKASGALLKTRGLDGAIRGVREGAQRPDFALIDDPDTDESANSPSQQEKREQTIDRAIGGMAGPGKKLGRVLLGTLINTTCLAARYTDPKIKPSFKGKRFRFLKAMPTNEDLWAEFVTLRQQGFDPNSDVEMEAAHKFYLKNRKAMDAGAIISNPYRFNPRAFPPESSALEHFYNEVADKGWPVVLTELQNDPPAEEGSEASGITPAIIQKRLNHWEMNVVEPGALCRVGFIDTGQSKGCHYGVAAVYPGFRLAICDYGVQEVNNIETLGPQRALLGALRAWREHRLQYPYVDSNGEPIRLDCVLIDAGDGNLEPAVTQFVREAGLPFRASKGFGSRHDLSPFRSVQKRTKDRIPGDHLYLSRQPSGVWLTCLDSDYWKQFVHDRFMTAHVDEHSQLRQGAITLFGNDERTHHSFARHICAEVQERTFIRDKGWDWTWVVKNRNNDYLDMTAGLCAAASMCGARLSGPALPMPRRAAGGGRRSIRFAS